MLRPGRNHDPGAERRHAHWNVQKWLPINCSTNLTCTMSGGVVTMSASGGVAGPSFNCASMQYANLKACLDAAKTYASNGNAGSDNAAYIYLPSGTLSLSGTPYTLTGGMQIMGVAPRVEYIAGTSADLNMIPDGGTWIDCGGNQCFTGTGIRGLSITNVGFQDFCTSGTSGCSVFTFGNGNGGTGGAGVDGVAWSTFSNLIAIGHTCSSGLSGCYSDQAWVFYNSQHIHGDFMTAFNTNVGLNLISQGPEEPMNSVFSDIYTYTYAKSSANGNSSKPGLWLQCLTDGAGNTSGLFDDGSLTYARLAYQYWVVLGAAAENMNHALQLAFTSHQRIELGIHRGLGQVAGKLTQQGRFALTLGLSFFLAGTGQFLADGRKV